VKQSWQSCLEFRRSILHTFFRISRNILHIKIGHSCIVTCILKLIMHQITYDSLLLLRLYTHTHTHTLLRLYTCVYICIYIYINHSHTHTHTHTHTHSKTPSERVISSSQKPLSTQHTTWTSMDIHAISGIRTRDPSNQATSDLCLRPHDTGTTTIRFHSAVKCVKESKKKKNENPRSRSPLIAQ